MAQPLLALSELSKRFTGTLALDRVDFDLREGEVHALLGENGAGKSTLIKILAGVHPGDGGSIRLRGREVQPMSEPLPITFIHQDLGLVDTMSVAENVAILAGYPRRAGLIDWPRAHDLANSVLDRMGGGIDPLARVGDLPAAEKSIVAIARALAVPCDVLVLDEPTAALPERDVARLHDALLRLREKGLGIIYVTHRLDEVFRIADRVTVLRDGRRVTTDAIADTSPAKLVHDIVGRALEEAFVHAEPQAGPDALAVRGLRIGEVGPVSFSVRVGEVVGLVGLRGAGHDRLGRAVFGDTPASGGTLMLDGRPFMPATPAEAVARKVGFVSSKRGEESLARNLSVRENAFMNPLMTGGRHVRPMQPGAERRRCLDLLRRFSVRPPDPERVVSSLSGGNQQKVVLARWMEAGSRLLVLEEPTIGVDVGSKAEIYRLLRDALGRGLAVLLISSDFEEVAGICHRALVFDRGQVAAEFAGRDLTIARLTAAASGGEDGMIKARLA